jgi:hypothetical protein
LQVEMEMGPSWYPRHEHQVSWPLKFLTSSSMMKQAFYLGKH